MKTKRTIIHNWEELAALKESNTHVVDVDLDAGFGHLRAKDPRPYDLNGDYMLQVPHLNVYLSTHTFYGKTYKASTKLMHACGFNVDIDNWDKELDT